NDDDSETEWTPHAAARRVLSSAPSTSMEQAAGSMNGTFRFETGAGTVTASRGWGGQPRISSRAPDFGGAAAPTDYPGLGNILHATGDPEDVAHNMVLAAEDDDDADFGGLSHREQRAAAMTIGITQVAEQHPRRTPGSAAVGRAAFRAVADGTMTFPEAIATMPFAPRGGTRVMREIGSGDREMTDEQASMISNLDDEEFEPLWSPPTFGHPPGPGPWGGGGPPPAGGAGGAGMLLT
ncbi:MAG: hypothetical protein ACREE3_16970, partial [Stellaceae bacterium]